MLINEIITHGKGPFIVYFRGDSWGFESETEELDIEGNYEHRDFKNKIEPYIQQITDSDFELEDDMAIDDILNELDESGEIIAGTIDGDTFELSPLISLNFRHSTANKNVLKILDEYGLKRVRTFFTQFTNEGDEIEQIIEHGKEEFLEPLQNKTFYHGTSFDALGDILKKGLMGNVNKTNFDKIEHEDTIFLSLNYEKATFHALHAAQQNNTLPIVVELEVPDVSKLVLDYDIAIDLYGKDHPLTMKLDYDDINNIATGHIGIEFYNGMKHGIDQSYIEQITDKSSLNTKLGVFGYKGRIPPSKIKNIHIDREGLEAWVKADEFGMDLKEFGYEIQEFVNSSVRLSGSEIQQTIDNIREEIQRELEDEDEDDY